MTRERNFHMLGGSGENSYAANSTLQKKMASDAMFVVKEALESLVSVIPSSEMLLVFADLGCSTGTNTFVMISEVTNTIATACNKLGRPVPEIQLLLNDLPGNDFNTLLGPVISSFKESITESMRNKSIPLYTAAVSGSFYERLFPKKSVHFVYSSVSLHWLSQVPDGLSNAKEGPINKTSFWISKKGPSVVSKLYLEQFQKDFSSFLKCRSEELCSNGHMALIFLARMSGDPSIEESEPWISWFEEAFYELVSQGIVKAADVESFNMPMYFPSIEEIKSVIQTEGSFEIIQNHVLPVNYPENMIINSDGGEECLKKIVMIIRAIMEPLIVSHFGDSIKDPLFSLVPKIYRKHLWKTEDKSFSIAVSLKKK